MDNPQKREAQFAWFLVWLWVVVITISTLVPGRVVPKLHGMDKIFHLLEFLALGILLLNAFMKSRFYASLNLLIILTIMLGCLYASLTEWMQNFVPGRNADVYDLLSDLIGLNLGVIMYLRGVRDWH